MAFLNPRSAPIPTFAIALMLAGTGITLSSTRLQTVAAERENNDIAQYRATICRILAAEEKVELGAYYFQPVHKGGGQMSGPLLNEGVYVCDLYGNTARIDRGGFAQHVVTATDISSLNRELQRRLEDSQNPDHSALSRVRRAANRGVYEQPAIDSAPQFFDLSNSEG